MGSQQQALMRRINTVDPTQLRVTVYRRDRVNTAESNIGLPLRYGVLSEGLTVLAYRLG